ncbi:Secretory component protein SHR3 [Verticillium dahliae VDG2]|nr:Secretory component protein SHR3 [Verticillium dahliae VDG2]
MISGMLYDSWIPPLTNARHECRILVHEYNTMPPSLGTADQVAAKRFEILKRWLGFVGEGVFIEPPFTPGYGCNVIIGKNSYMNFGFTVLDTSLVIIGERVMLGPNVHIYSAGHDTSVLSRVKCIEFGHQVRIEDDCWIGGNVTVLAGVTIG